VTNSSYKDAAALILLIFMAWPLVGSVAGAVLTTAVAYAAVLIFDLGSHRDH